MSTSCKRGNAYFAARLKKDGHRKPLELVESGELSMYKATQEADYRAMQPKSPAGKLAFHWKRASYEERYQFVVENYRALRPTINDVVADIEMRGCRNPSERTINTPTDQSACPNMYAIEQCIRTIRR